MTKKSELTTKDVQALLQNRTDDVKAKLGAKVANHLDFPEITDAEKRKSIIYEISKTKLSARRNERILQRVSSKYLKILTSFCHFIYVS